MFGDPVEAGGRDEAGGGEGGDEQTEYEGESLHDVPLTSWQHSSRPPAQRNGRSAWLGYRFCLGRLGKPDASSVDFDF